MSVNLGQQAQDILRALQSDRRNAAHAYETLMSSLFLADRERPIRTLMVSSTQPEEGKTTIASTLALSMALSGKRVLLVDADIKRPRVHQVFGIEPTPGLASLVQGEATVDETKHTILLPEEECVEGGGLTVVPSGTPTLATFSVMGSPKLPSVVAELGQPYEVVIFDSASLFAVRDALFLAPLVDGIIFVVGTGSVVAREARVARDQLRAAGGNLLGFVMNRFVESSHGHAAYQRYSTYYSSERGEG